MIRARVYYSGHVQGVGFRYTTDTIASRFEVCGFVKNLSDGRVEVDVEGETSHVDGFLEAIRERMEGFIHDVSIDKSEQTVGYTDFEIRY